MVEQLIANMMQSTTQGFIGVGLIFGYLLLIVFTALKRIAEGDLLHH